MGFCAMRPGATAAVTALVLGALAHPAAATLTQYECRFEQSRARGGGWIPEVLVITDNNRTGEIIVYDPVIKYFIGKPIPARRSTLSKVRTTYAWEFQAQNKGQAARMTYTLSYHSNGQPTRIRVQPGGYDNVWTGDGRCAVTSR
jgi:hypothetical protein